MDNLLSHLRVLKQLGLENNKLSEAILMYFVLQKIDVETFEMTLSCNELREWDVFIDFLLNRVQALENLKNKQKQSR